MQSLEQQPLIKQLSIVIVGSGTAGLISALLLRQAFPSSEITIISSSAIGIIGVGEGSTEHWAELMRLCDIPLTEMIAATNATHKYGIRFEGWTGDDERYFHSVSGIDEIYAWGHFATYDGLIESGQLFTNTTTTVGLVRDQIRVQNMHQNTNQFHFDTNSLNEYFVNLCFKRSIKFVDAEVVNVNKNPDNGTVSSVSTSIDIDITGDFWIDASGFKRVLMQRLDDYKWNSFSEFLPCNAAIAFPTESNPNGKIHPYTRAIAASSGWVWEIPTQTRRGNGYVFSSDFLTDDEAYAEAERVSGYKIDKSKIFKFDAGYLENSWVKNCCSVGLASAFVEPLEATSIGSTIQQVRMLIPYMAAYDSSYSKSQIHYNKAFSRMMRNVLTMIRLHYYNCRTDSPFWQHVSNMPVNDELQELIDLWSEVPPMRVDPNIAQNFMFHTPHLAHVAQGQRLLENRMSATRVMDRLNIRQRTLAEIESLRNARYNHELIDHGEALRLITSIDREWE